LRLQGTEPQRIKDIITNNFGLNYESVKETDPEWRTCKNDITFPITKDKDKISPSDYIKVPFKEALNLVSKREVYVRAGLAYVPLTKLTTIA